MPTLIRLPALLITGGLLLTACVPAVTTPQATVYQARPAEVEQVIREVSASFATLPGFQSLVIVPGKSKDGQVFLTSPVRVNDRGQVTSAVNVLDERELIFLLSGSNGETTLDYRMKGQLDQQLKTVLNALDQRFTRLNTP